MQFVTFLILLLSFCFGVRRFFRRKIPMYFQLLIAGVGCFVLAEVSRLVSVLQRTDYAYFTISYVGSIGGFLFLLSANYGQLDGVVDDRSIASNRRARRIALLAPAALLLMTAALAAAFGARMRPEKCAAVVLCGVLAALASYYDLKHLLLPVDDFGFLRATRGCNIAALLLYLVTLAGEYASAGAAGIWPTVFPCLLHLTAAGMVLACERGLKQWGALF